MAIKPKVVKLSPRERKKQRLRKRIIGSDLKPRLCVFRSERHTYAQLLSDESGKTIAAASTLEPVVLEKVAGIKAEGYSAEAGVRSMMTPNIEGYAMLGYQDGDDFDGDAYGRLGAAVKFNQNWGATAEVKLVNGGDTQWFVGPRFTW